MCLLHARLHLVSYHLHPVAAHGEENATVRHATGTQRKPGGQRFSWLEACARQAALTGEVRGLRFSSGCSAEGQALRNICDDAGLLQKVREPTRNQYLLDLALTDLSDTLRVEVLPAITDHKLVMCRLRIATPIYHAVTRYVWDYKRARWDGLKQAFANSDWQYLASGSVDTAVETFTRHVLNTSRALIHTGGCGNAKAPTPGLPRRVRQQSVRRSRPKVAHITRMSAVAATLFFRPRTHYMRRVRDRLANLPRGSKAWWKWNRVLLNKSRKTACAPPLRTNAGLMGLGCQR